MDDLIDDPAFVGGELRVTDSAVSLTIARSLMGEVLRLGVTGTLARSSVLETHGSAAFVDLGLHARPTDWLAFGFAVRRLGPDFRWETAGGERFATGIARAIRLGTAVRDLLIGPFQITLAGDLESGSSLGGEEIGLGLETDLGPASFRLGLHRPAGARVAWTGGLGLRFHEFRGDLGYEWREIVGPRLNVGLTYARPNGKDDG